MSNGRRLAEAFRIDVVAKKELIALVGGGGKTSLIQAVARAVPGRVVLTTTTRLGRQQVAEMAVTTAVFTYPHLDALAQHLAQAHAALLVGVREGDKVRGVPLALPAQLLQADTADVVVVEADGARLRPLKAPAAHEPAMPDGATLVVPVVGIDAVGRSADEVAHRPERVVALLAARGEEVTRDEPLTAAHVAAVLVDAQGGLKAVPAAAQVIPFINKVETAAQRAVARQIARAALREPRITQVVVGAAQRDPVVVEVVQRVTAVILAAGEGTRMGRTKQLLPWGETTVLGQTIRNVKRSGVHQVVVVTGHAAARVEEIAAAAGVGVVHNPDYATGEMLSSLQTAVAQLPPSAAAVLVVLADQPTVAPETMDRLLAAFWQGEREIVAPVYDGRRGNPVLIGRRHFAQLLALPPGAAPRDLLRREAVYLVEVDSASVLQDLDRPEEYERLRPRGERP